MLIRLPLRSKQQAPVGADRQVKVKGSGHLFWAAHLQRSQYPRPSSALSHSQSNGAEHYMGRMIEQADAQCKTKSGEDREIELFSCALRSARFLSFQAWTLSQYSF